MCHRQYPGPVNARTDASVLVLAKRSVNMHINRNFNTYVLTATVRSVMERSVMTVKRLAGAVLPGGLTKFESRVGEVPNIHHKSFGRLDLCGLPTIDPSKRPSRSLSSCQLTPAPPLLCQCCALSERPLGLHNLPQHCALHLDARQFILLPADRQTGLSHSLLRPRRGRC